MSFVLLAVDLVVLIHEAILSPNELQGPAADKSLDGALARIDNRLAFGMVDDVYSLAAAYAAAIAQGRYFNGKRCVNRGVAYRACAGIFFTAHGSRLSMSSTVSTCGSTVNTRLRY
jgi:death-on-curing protein